MLSTQLRPKVHGSCNSVCFSHSQNHIPLMRKGNVFSSLVASLLPYLSLVCCIFPFMALISEGSLWLTSWASWFPSHGQHKHRRNCFQLVKLLGTESLRSTALFWSWSITLLILIIAFENFHYGSIYCLKCVPPFYRFYMLAQYFSPFYVNKQHRLISCLMNVSYLVMVQLICMWAKYFPINLQYSS